MRQKSRSLSGGTLSGVLVMRIGEEKLENVHKLCLGYFSIVHHLRIFKSLERAQIVLQEFLWTCSWGIKTLCFASISIYSLIRKKADQCLQTQHCTSPGTPSGPVRGLAVFAFLASRECPFSSDRCVNNQLLSFLTSLCRAHLFSVSFGYPDQQ
jgi:hypothetical protein